MQYRLQQEFGRAGKDPELVRFHLFDSSDQVLATHNPRVRQIFRNKLNERGVTLHLGSPVSRVGNNRLETAAGETLDADEVLWVTLAGGPAWLEDTGLALDEGGFIRVLDTLQTETDENIFAAGDIANMVNHPREKAGVFAVRQALPDRQPQAAGPGKTPKPFRPNRNGWSLSAPVTSLR